MEFLNKNCVLSFFYSDVEVTEKRNRLDAIFAKTNFSLKRNLFRVFSDFCISHFILIPRLFLKTPSLVFFRL